MTKVQAIVMKPDDNVATVVDIVKAGMDVSVDIGGAKMTITVMEAIPFGHKFALREIETGRPVKKYGEIIGIATKNISMGQHVHVHNLESCRGRGDK